MIEMHIGVNGLHPLDLTKYHRLQTRIVNIKTASELEELVGELSDTVRFYSNKHFIGRALLGLALSIAKGLFLGTLDEFYLTTSKKYSMSVSMLKRNIVVGRIVAVYPLFYTYNGGFSVISERSKELHEMFQADPALKVRYQKMPVPCESNCDLVG